MKKLIVAILCLFIIGISFIPKVRASVSNMVTQLGVYNSTDSQFGLEVDNNNVFKFAATGAGIYYPGSAKTTNFTLTANQSGQTFVMTGSSGNTQFTLPTAVVGMKYIFIDDTTNYIQIVPQSTDTINFASLAQGVGIKNSSTPAKGDAITLFCAVAGKWSIDTMRNTWVSGP